MRVMLDPGHGGSDPGAIGNGLRESEVNLAVAKTARAHLLKLLPSIPVALTREDDRTLTPQQRLKIVRDFVPDICISIHQNSAQNITAWGAEVFYSNGDSRGKELAELIGKYLRAAKRNWRGAKTRLASNGRDYYYMIRDVNTNKTVALLSEGAFLSNPADAQWLKTGGMEQQGRAIADAVAEYVRRKQPSPAPPKPQLPPMPKQVVPALVDNEVVGQMQGAYIIDGKTYVELRSTAEALGLKVHWVANDKPIKLRR